jgi:hypothetical protein
MGPPRPLYYEEEVPFGCSAAVAAHGHFFYPGRFAGKKHACDKGYKKNEPIPPHVWDSTNWKMSFKDQYNVWHKLHLFKVDLDVDGVPGVDFPNVGHGYSPREGDTDAYPQVIGVRFYRTIGKYCGQVTWTDPEGETVRYDVILNKKD